MTGLKDGRKFNWTMVENEIIDNFDRYTQNEVMAYLVIARYANSDSQCFPSYKTIAEKMRCSKKTAINAIDSLVKKGVLIKETRKNKGSSENISNLYTLVGAEENREIAKAVEKVREEKRIKAEEKKNLNEHSSIKMIKSYIPEMRLGRNQKLEIIKLDKSILEDAIDRTVFHGGKTFNYLMLTYKTIKEEKENEFKLTDEHEMAFINFNEIGYDKLSFKEKILIDQMRRNNIITK